MASTAATYHRGPNTLVVPVSMHAEIRQNLINRLVAARVPQAGSVILLEGGKSVFRAQTDHEELFRQESFFHYLFGVKEPDCWGALNLSTGHATLFMPNFPREYGVWMGHIRTKDEFKHMYGVEEVLFVEDVPNWLDKHLTPQGKIHLIKGFNTDSKETVLPPTLPGKYKDHAAIDTEALWNEIVECRVHKTVEEQKVLRYACKASSDAHEFVMKNFKPGSMEYTAEANFVWFSYHNCGCRHTGYTCICASGDNSSILHYGHAAEPNAKIIDKDEMLLFDMGAEYYCYGADITRSFPSSGKFNAKQRMVYSAVLDAQEAVIKVMKPGVYWPDMQKLAMEVILKHLVAAGLVNNFPIEELYNNDIGYCFMPHGLGHLLGLETHDVGGVPQGGQRFITPESLRPLRCVRKLEEGMVITVEPGLYFNDTSLDLFLSNPAKAKYLNKAAIDAYRGFGGVRIEDDLLVTADGVENFTTAAKSIEDIEKLLAQNLNLHK